MPVDSSTAYIPLDGSSHGGCWGQRTSLERGLIFIVAFLALVVLTLTIAIAYKKCDEPPVTTVAPSSTTPHNVTTAPTKTTTKSPKPSPTGPTKTTTKSPTPSPTGPTKTTTKSPTPKPSSGPTKTTTKSPAPKLTDPPKPTHKSSSASPHSSTTKKSDLTYVAPTVTKNETSSTNLEANEVSAKNVSGADLVSTTADNKTLS